VGSEMCIRDRDSNDQPAIDLLEEEIDRLEKDPAYFESLVLD